MKKITSIVLLFFVFTCGHAREFRKEIIVSAAMSLKNVMSKIGLDFEKKFADVKVNFNFAGSGQLRAQIEAGAPADIFISASQAEMDTLAGTGILLSGTIKMVATNELVLVCNNTSNAKIKSIMQLTDKEISKIAIGNPATVASGRYAREALVFYKIFDLAKDKLVFGENVRQVLDYVSRNEVDAGFVFITDVKTNKNVKILQAFPALSHKPIVYPAAVIKTSKQIEAAKEFMNFLTTKESKDVWKEYGFGPVSTERE